MKNFQSHLLRFNLSRRFAISLLGLSALAAAVPGLCAPIHDAVRAGDLAKVEALVKEHPDLVSSADEQYGQTPLHIAAFNDHKVVAEFLLANKADVNAKAKNGSTPLHLAAAKGNKDIVELLLANKAEINALDNDGWSPVHSAVVWHQKEIEDLLIAKGGTELPAPKKPPVAAPAADSKGVRTPPKETGKDGRFTAYDDGTVLDTQAKLMWMGRDNGAPLSWPNAKSYVASYNAAGYSDWRLPTLAELTALYDKAKTRRSFCPAAVDEMGVQVDDVHLPDLFHLTCIRVWTSQQRSGKPDSATIFDFHTGKDAARPDAKDFIDTASRVLVVRDVK
ncbi:MAG: ankyrin repeat domain-containing protein [Terracidiphilus sp.]|jgi:hypothetical protein